MGMLLQYQAVCVNYLGAKVPPCVRAGLDTLAF